MRYGTFKYGQQKYGELTILDMTLVWIIEIDWDGDGAFDGTNEALRTVGFSSRRGQENYLSISEDGETDGLGRMPPGEVTLTLLNGDRRYDPYNTSSPLYGLIRPGRLVRIQVLDQETDTTHPVFAGKIKDIHPIGGTDRATLTAVDGMELLQRQDAKVDIQTSIAVSDAVGLILDAVSWPAGWGRSIQANLNYVYYWWSNRKAITEIHDLIYATLGRFFVAADGKATYYTVAGIHATEGSLTQDQVGREIPMPMPWEHICNAVSIRVHPRLKSTEVDLWTLIDIPSIAAGETKTFWATFQYNGQAVPAVETVSPVATTDYTGNTAADGSGANITANLSVVMTPFGETASVVVTNSGGSAGYITLLKVRGKAIYLENETTIIAEDAASQAIYGVRKLSIDSRWQQSLDGAKGHAESLLDNLKDEVILPDLTIEGRHDLQFRDMDLLRFIQVDIDELNLHALLKVAFLSHEWLNENGQAVLTTLKFMPDWV